MKVKIAVLPVAGLGTRIMPLTLHQPKPMVGIVDRPMIHYVIDEIVSAGIRHIIIVHGPEQEQFKKYIKFLEKDPAWKKMKVKFEFALQKRQIGNGDAVYAARKFVKNQPFLVAFSDDLLSDKKPPIKTLVSLFKKTGSPVIMIDPIPKKLVHRYGVVKIKKTATKDIYQILDVVEKPKTEEAPSNFTVIGRYVLTPKLLEYIGKLYPYEGDREVGLADALRNYAKDGYKLYGWRFRGKRFDAGSKIGILKAQVYFGLRHNDLGPEFKKYLKSFKSST